MAATRQVLGSCRVPKDWGWEEWITNKPEYCGKILHIDPGKKGSWHYHKSKDETFQVLVGELTLLHGDDDDVAKSRAMTLRVGQSAHMPPRTRHQLICAGPTACELIEISTQHFDDDSYRIIKGD